MTYQYYDYSNHSLRILVAGLVGGFIGNGVLGALFPSPPIQSILYNPEWQSQLFIEITPKRNIPVSVAGLVILSVIHAWLFSVFMPSIPGKTWLKKGLFKRGGVILLAPPTSRSRGLANVFQLQEGQWRIIHDQNTALDYAAFARSAGIEIK